VIAKDPFNRVLVVMCNNFSTAYPVKPEVATTDEEYYIDEASAKTALASYLEERVSAFSDRAKKLRAEAS
jgi:hypothetical protein